MKRKLKKKTKAKEKTLDEIRAEDLAKRIKFFEETGGEFIHQAGCNLIRGDS